MKLYVVKSKQGPESASRTQVFRDLHGALVMFGRLVERWEVFLNEPMAIDLGSALSTGDLRTGDMAVAWPRRGHMARDVKVSIEVEHQFNYST